MLKCTSFLSDFIDVSIGFFFVEEGRIFLKFCSIQKS